MYYLLDDLLYEINLITIIIITIIFLIMGIFLIAHYFNLLKVNTPTGTENRFN